MALDPLELESYIGGGELSDMGTGNQTWVLERAASSLTRKGF